MRIFFSVGEPSGDEHAAHLIQELKRHDPDLEPVGYGGPAMETAGCQLRFRLTNLAVMGFLRVIPLLGKFIALARRAGREFRENPPDAVVLVDFPGFNWWIARAASRAGVPVYFYMPPQLWAWAPWRIRRMRKYVDHVLCALPFEYDWYTQRGVRATYVGHPFFDEVADKRLDKDFAVTLRSHGRRPVALLPGSRNHEVERNFPLMLQVAARLANQHTDVDFHVACYNERQQAACERLLAQQPHSPPMTLHTGRTSELIAEADCCLMVSGSVSLELLARATPGVVLYRLTRVHTTLRPVFVRCRYITLTNLIAGREIMPEFVSSGPEEKTVRSIFEILNGWLQQPDALAERTRELQALADETVVTGATKNAAQTILEQHPMRARRSAA